VPGRVDGICWWGCTGSEPIGSGGGGGGGYSNGGNGNPGNWNTSFLNGFTQFDTATDNVSPSPSACIKPPSRVRRKKSGCTYILITEAIVIRALNIRAYAHTSKIKK